MDEGTWEFTHNARESFHISSNSSSFVIWRHCRLIKSVVTYKTGFDLSGCPGGIHALKFVRPTQD